MEDAVIGSRSIGVHFRQLEWQFGLVEGVGRGYLHFGQERIGEEFLVHPGFKFWVGKEQLNHSHFVKFAELRNGLDLTGIQAGVPSKSNLLFYSVEALEEEISILILVGC